METKRFTQFGTFSVIVLSPITLIFGYLLIRSFLESSPEIWIHLLLFSVFLICLLTFYKLTIVLTKNEISFKLGVGLFGKTYKLNQIESCSPIKNSPIFGIGIRIIPNGWLYNVTGTSAIELRFKGKSSVVRIGTNIPDEICKAVNSISSGIVTNTIPNRKGKLVSWAFVVVIALVILIPIVLIISGSKDSDVVLGKEVFQVKGIYGVDIPINEIIRIDTVSTLPNIVLRTNGYAFGKTRVGYFRLKDKSTVKLFVKAGNPPYIVVESKEQNPIYLNFKSKAQTLDLFNKLSTTFEDKDLD